MKVYKVFELITFTTIAGEIMRGPVESVVETECGHNATRFMYEVRMGEDQERAGYADTGTLYEVQDVGVGEVFMQGRKFTRTYED